MSKKTKIEEIKEIVQSNGLCLDISRPFGRIPRNLTKEELREKYFRPEFFGAGLDEMTIPELKRELKKLEDLRNVGK